MTAHRRLLAVLLTLLIGALPLTWVGVASLGGFGLSVPYALALVTGLALCLSPGAMALGLGRLLPAMAPWLFAYAFYLLILQLSLAGAAGKGIVMRQVFFMACGVIMAGGLVAARADPRILRCGGLLAILCFLAIVEVLARQIGLGWIPVIKHFATTGDLNFIFYDFLKELFQLASLDGAVAQASDKNLAAVAILSAMLLYRAGHTGRGSDRLGRLVSLLALAVLVILSTRSVVLMAVICLPLAGWIGALRHGVRSPGEFIVKSLGFLGLMFGGVLLLTTDAAAVAMIEDRFSFSDASSGNRFLQYSWALERIEASPIWGSGLAEFRGQPVHNLFLSAWMQAGLLGFLLVCFSYVTMVTAWIVFMLRIVTQRGYWVLSVRAEWVAVLPLLPLFRVWIAGDGGHPSFVEWSTLGAFAGLVIANRLARGAWTESARRLPEGAAPA